MVSTMKSVQLGSTTYIETLTIRNWWKTGILYPNFSCSKYIYLIFTFFELFTLKKANRLNSKRVTKVKGHYFKS